MSLTMHQKTGAESGHMTLALNGRFVTKEGGFFVDRKKKQRPHPKMRPLDT